MFDVAYNQTRKFEGGYSNNKNDRGGPTIFGISSKHWPNDFATVKNLVDTGRTKEAEEYTKNFYKTNFWDASGAEKAPPEMQAPLFDAAVHHGVGTAKKMLASSSGPNQFLDQRQDYMNKIVQNDPTQATFQKGWNNRAQAQKSPAPEELTPQEAAELAQLEAEFEAPKTDELTPEEQSELAQLEAEIEPKAPQEKGFIGRVGDKWAARDADMEKASDFAGEGKISNAGLRYIAVGNTLGKGFSDIPAEAMVSMARATPQPVKEFAGDVYSAAKNTPVLGPTLRTGGYVLNQASQGYDKFKRNHPVGGLFADATLGYGDAALAALPVKGQSLPSHTVTQGQKVASKTARIASDVGGEAAQAARKAASSGLQKIPSIDNALGKTVRPKAEQLKSVSRANYAKAKELGGIAPSGVTDRLIDKAVSFRPTDEMVLATRGQTLSDKLAESWEPFRGQSMDLERATALDQHITDLLDDAAATNKNGILNSQGHQILELKEELRNALEDAAQSGEIGGGPEGLRAYQTAVKDWAAQSQISEIERIVQRASTMDNPATSLKTGFRNIANNPKRLNKFPKNVQKAIIHASKDGDISNILRTEIGSRLISTMVGAAGGSTMGPLGSLAGGAAGFAASRAARKGAESLQMGRVNKVVDSIAANSSMPTKKVPLSQLIKPAEASETKKALAKSLKK